MPKLTKTFVDGLKPKDSDFFEWDEALPGFGVRVWPSGKKTYVAQYRADGRSRRMKLGAHGPLTVEEARRAAKAALGEVAAGEDPQKDKTTRRKSITVAELCDDYMRAVEKGLVMGKGGGPKKASTVISDRGRIERHIKPLIGNRLVIDLTRADITGLIADVSEGKTATTGKSGKLRGTINVRGGTYAASRTKGLMGGILSYAIDRGVIEANPAGGVKVAANRKRHRRFSDAELKSLGAAIREADGEYWPTLAFCKLALLTGWRKSEIQGLRWDALDLEHATVILADSKEGRSIRPLGAPVVKLLSSLDRRGDYVLPSLRQSEHFGAGYKAFVRICGRAGITSVSPHTARHTLVTKGQEIGFSESLSGAVVGHKKAGVTAGYTHFAPPVLVDVATAISSEIARLMGFVDLLPEAAETDAPDAA